jgi:hypothetical protein
LTLAIGVDGFPTGAGDAGFFADFEVGFIEKLLIRTE